MNDKKKKPAPGPFDALRPLRDAMQARERADTDAKAGKGGNGSKGNAAGASGRKPGARQPAPPPTARDARPTTPAAREGSEDEALLFHRMYAGVEPIDRSRGRVTRQAMEPSEAAQRAARRGAEKAQQESDAVREHLRTLVEGNERFEVSDDGRRVEGRRIDVPADLLRKLRRGNLPMDGRLDLHGMTVPEARAQLELFLRTMRARGERCVLVIHGRGEHSPHGTGVLRGEIAAWLSQGGASEQVAAFATAQGPDGGEGAVYVLVRR